MLLKIFLVVASSRVIAAEICSNLSDVAFIFVNRNVNNTVAVPFAKSRDLMCMEGFDYSKTTVIYTFGWGSSYQKLNTRTVVSAFLAETDFNILVVDWSQYAGGNYVLDTLDYVAAVGTVLGKTLARMKNEGFGQFYLVGHSLGAHLMGYAGRTAAALSFRLPRITGLDPASPGFFPLNPFLIPLSRYDATFVDIMHTNSAFFGAPMSTGTVDFWPNGGALQPGCPPFDPATSFVPNSDCDHSRAWIYYAESVLAKNSNESFLAVKCTSWNDFTSHQCLNQTAQMGFNANANLQGDFFLQTNGQSTYPRNQNGIIYE